MQNFNIKGIISPEKLPFGKVCNFIAIYDGTMEKSQQRAGIFFTTDLKEDLSRLTGTYRKERVFLVTESTVNRLWIEKEPYFGIFPGLVLPPGEENKTISSVVAIWEFLSGRGADRKSLLINVGGGMLTDLAGFAASTFKRGIDFVNIPTTLLSQVDASAGGKTGINFKGLKNEIGTFREPAAVFIYPPFLMTLDPKNFLSGFAEMIKHGLIHDPGHLHELRNFDLKSIDFGKLQEIIRHSVDVKSYFISNDPYEKNIRKALNFGHTFGHALESLLMERNQPVLHGYAVAWGMVAELYLSTATSGFPEQETLRLGRWIKELYGPVRSNPDDFNRICELMKHDKKNEGDINFTLLSGIGKFVINRSCPGDKLRHAFDFLLNI